MDLLGPLVSQGGLGLVAAIFLWLFIQERKEHREDHRTDQTAIRELQDARLSDQRDTTREVTTVLQGNAQAMTVLSEKIEIGKRNGRME